MEDRRLLAAMGPVDPANSAGWQAVIVELKADSGNVQDVAPRLLHASSGRLDHSCGHELLDPTN